MMAASPRWASSSVTDVAGWQVEVRVDEIRPGDRFLNGDRVLSVTPVNDGAAVEVAYEYETQRRVWDGDEQRHVPTAVTETDKIDVRRGALWWVVREDQAVTS